MSLPVITETITAPDTTAVSGAVRLWAQDGGGGTAYTNAGTPITLGGIVRVSFNALGVLKADDGTTALTLNPNSGASADAIATPVGTEWRYEIRYPGTRTPDVRFLTVPDVAGPLQVSAILTDEPGSIASPGSKAYTDAAIANIGTTIALTGDVGGTAGANVIGAGKVGLAKLGVDVTAVAIGGLTAANNGSDFASLPKTRRTMKVRDRQDDLLLPFFAALGQVATTPVVIVVAPADSIMGTCPGSYMGTHGTVRRLHEALARRYNKYGTPGRGWLPIYSDDVTNGLFPYGWGNVAGTSSGAACAGTTPTGGGAFGLGAWGRTLAVGNIVTHVDPLGFDGLDIFYTAQATGSGATVGLVITDSTGAVLYTNASAFSTSDAGLSGSTKRSGNKFSTGQLTGIASQVVLTVSGSGSAMLDYSYLHMGTVSSGVQVHAGAHTGFITGQFNSAAVCYATVATLQPHLVITDTGTNDYSFGLTTAQYKAALATAWSGITAVSPDTPIAHVSAYQGQGRTDWDLWRVAAEDQARTSGVAFVDAYERMGDLSNGVDPYDLSDDGIHPNDKGHGVLAAALDSVIRPGGGENTAPSAADGLLKLFKDSGGYPVVQGVLHQKDAIQAFSLGYDNTLGAALALGNGTGGTAPTGVALLGVNAAGTRFNLFNTWGIVGAADATTATELMNRQSVDARHGVPDASTVEVAASVLRVKDLGITNAKVATSAAIALSKLATIATARLLGNVTGSSAVPAELTGAQAGALITPNNLAAATGSWSLGQSFTATVLAQQTGTAFNGKIIGETGGADASNLDVGFTFFTNSGFTNPTISLVFVSASAVTFFNGLYLGDGTDSAQDVSYTRTGTNAAKISASAGLTLTGNLILSTKNLVTDGTTGTKIGTATSQKIGLWNVTPVIQYATTGTATGFTAGAGTTATSLSTFTGNTGATAYTTGDIVRALKLCGVMAA